MHLLTRPEEDRSALDRARASVRANMRLFEYFGKECSVPAGESVFEQGEVGDSLFVVRTGVIEIQSDYMLIGAAYAYDIFGEMALIDGGPRSATAHCAADAQLLRLDRDAFHNVLRIDPGFAELLLRRMSQRIRHLNVLARTDALTGVLARGHFMDLAERELLRARRESAPLGVLMLDADHFKAINDTYGHAAGDTALQQIAAAARVQLRPSDGLGRMGGEEFAAVLPSAGGAEAMLVAERLRRAVEKARIETEDGRVIPCTVSIGSTCVAGREESFEAALNRADALLYQAKESGRNRVVGDSPKV